MPDRAVQMSVQRWLNEILERLRNVERIAFQSGPGAEAIEDDDLAPYTWQSARTLTVGAGHRYFTERAGEIIFARAERSSGDGTSTAKLDVLKNGVSIFTDATKPRVPAGTRLGDEATPVARTFEKGDSFQVKIDLTGGGSGPLRLTIKFKALV